MLRKGQLNEALGLYNEAAIWAPCKAWDSPELAAACACRGAASYQLGNHLVALEDVYYAMQTVSFNGGIRFKTECRLKAAHRGEAARQSLLAIKDFLGGLEASGFQEEQKEEVRWIIEGVMERVEKEGGHDKVIRGPTKVNKVAHSHRHLPSLSSALRVAHRPRDIQEGEVVAMEAASASRLLPLPSLSSRCCHCIAAVQIVFPCLTCTAVVFCSRDCRAAAAAPSISGNGKRGAHHQWECSWALTDLALEGVEGRQLACARFWLAARLFTQRRVGWMVDKQELLQGGDALHNVDSNDPGEEDGDEENQEMVENPLDVDEEEKMYEDVFNLVSHTNPSITQEVGEDFQLKHTTIAILLLCMLERVGWLENFSCKGWSAEKEVIAKQLLLALAVVRCFPSQFLTQPTLFVRFNGQPIKGPDGSSIGQALEPSLALANHACDPAMRRENVDTKAILVMSKGLRRGEEASVNYLPGKVHSQEERRSLLRRDYWFSCQCTVCQDSEEDF